MPKFVMTTSAQQQKKEIRFRVMRAVSRNPEITQRELANELGISLGRVNYCLKALIEKGSIKVDNFRKSENKLRYTYLLTSQGIAEKTALTRQFLKRKLEEYDRLRVDIKSLEIESRFK